MAGKIQIKLGDLFNGASDLLVLPCSTSGTITQFVYERLEFYKIPVPKTNMLLGDVELMEFTGAEHIAQYVAYAVSVRENRSDLSAIEEIGRRLGYLTKINSAIKVIHAPLLGTGAGGLQSEDVIKSLKKGFSKNSNSESSLILHILDQSVFDKVNKYFNNAKKSVTSHSNKHSLNNHIRVFISYTKTDEEHLNWVKDLASFLRANGIDARMDIWHLKTGMDLPQFMTNELSLADKVIIVSNEKYAEKADGRFGGVGWETMIIQGDLSKLSPETTKYITIVKEDDLEKGLPIFLKTKYVIHWKKNQDELINRNFLLAELLNTNFAPPIGLPPIFI